MKSNKFNNILKKLNIIKLQITIFIINIIIVFTLLTFLLSTTLSIIDEIKEDRKVSIYINIESIKKDIEDAKLKAYDIGHYSSDVEKREAIISSNSIYSEVNNLRYVINQTENLKNKEELQIDFDNFKDDVVKIKGLLILKDKRRDIKYEIDSLNEKIIERDIENIDELINQIQLRIRSLPSWKEDLQRNLREVEDMLELIRTGKVTV